MQLGCSLRRHDRECLPRPVCVVRIPCRLPGTEEDRRRKIVFWKAAGLTHLRAHTIYVSGHHKRIAGRSASEHLAAITRYRAAVADLL